MTPERSEKLLRVLSKRQSNLTVLLENIEDPHNVSAVLRTCESVGIQDVYSLTTKVPKHKRWGYRSSSGAYKWVTVHQFSDLEECVATIRKHYHRILTTHLGSDSVSLYELDFTGSLALAFGNERTGVSDGLRALADGNFLIPQVGIIQSLNISVACAVTLYEAFRQRTAAGLYNQPSLSPERMEAIRKEWGFWQTENISE